MGKNQNILLNMIASLGIKGLGMILTFFLMPAYLRYFQNQEILGMWFTILSLLNWVLTFDFGIGNGLRNKLTVALSNKNYDMVKKLISTTYYLSIILAVFLFFIGIVFIINTNWNSFFNISTQTISHDILKKSVTIVLIGIVLQFVFKVTNSILLAIQMPSISNLLGLVSNFIIFISVNLLRSTNDENSLIQLSYIYTIASNAPLMVATLIIFLTKFKKARPSVKYLDRYVSKSVLKLGFGFFFLQILSFALFNTKEFLISWTTSPENVVNFQIYHKVFQLIVSLAWIALIPMWSAITEAYAEKNYDWMYKVYNKLRGFMIPIVLGLVFLNVIFQPLVDIWLGDNSIQIENKYTIAFSIYSALYIWWGIIASFANGTGKIKTQIIMSVFAVVLNVTLSVVFVNWSSNWISIIYANIIAMIPYCIIEPFNIRKLINRGKTSI